jgi:protein TonB
MRKEAALVVAFTFCCCSLLGQAARTQTDPASPQAAATPAAKPNSVRGIRLTGGDPIYPPEARRAHVTGIVVLRAVISTEGKITNLTVVSGPEPLRNAALAAVQKWTYSPYLVDGKPASVETTISVNFAMGTK